MDSPLTPYIPVAAVLGVAGLLAVLIPQVTSRLGPKSLTEIKSAAFECGSDPIGSARQPFAVKFYMVALLFIVFDVEAVFLYPWAVNFKALSWFGYVTMLVFASTLVVGLVYLGDIINGF
jgi:NADH-quinone oxidoreductase subunit A